jgi:ATP-dependent DNA helicase 2 subunit 1
MAALGQRIEVLSLTRDGVFDSSVFYDEFTAEHCGAAEGERALVVVNDGTELQREFLKKSRKRRRLKQTKLWLVPGKIGVPVGVYSLVSEAKKATSILVDGKDLGEIRREQMYICKDTGATIEKPTKSFVEYDGERLVFSNKELAGMRKVKFGNVTGAASVGFHLVGFVSADKITRDLTLKKSHFIAGEGGGCTAFQGLLRACVQENKGGVVRVCARRTRSDALRRAHPAARPG